jgi:hypothetical protein
MEFVGDLMMVRQGVTISPLLVPVVIGLAAMYFLPTIVAVLRHADDAASIFVINLFLGWTVIAWIIALAMAVRTTTRARARRAGTVVAVCRTCGSQVSVTQRFCSSCGAAL